MILRKLCTCPECKQEFYVEISQVLDFAVDAGLRKLLLDGKVNLPCCPDCGCTFSLDMPFLVNDSKFKRVIFFIPGPPGQVDPVSIRLLHNTLRIAFPKQKSYFKKPLIVNNWGELLRLLAEDTGATDINSSLDSLRQRLASFCAATSWEEKKNAVITRPELLNDEASSLLDSWIDDARKKGREDFEQMLILTRKFMRRCRAVGVETASNEFMEAMPVTVVSDGKSYVQLPWRPQEVLDAERLEDIQNLEEAARRDPAKLPELITLFEDCLQWPVVAEDPGIRAAVCLDLGAAYWNLAGGNAPGRLHRAIQCLNEALTVYTPETAPQRYAAAQNQLGLAYLDLPTYDQTENLQRAIACFGEALRFRTPEKEPLEYAATHNNLGMACTRMEDRDREANLLKGVAHFQEALHFYKVDGSPTEYAKVCNNLGTAYFDLHSVTLNDHYLQSAIKCYKNASNVCDKDSALSLLRASVLINLGKAYATLASQNTQYLHEAIEYYQEALATLDHEKSPRETASVYEGLGAVYEKLQNGRRTEHLVSAAGYYHKALSFLTPNTFPADLRRIALALGNLYFEQEDWDDAVTAYQESIVANETLYRVAVTDISRRRELGQTLELYNNRAYALARMGYCQEAVVQLEAGRAQILAESLSRDQASLGRLKPEDKAAFASVRELIKQLEAEARFLGTTQSGLSTARSFTELSSDLRTARQELIEILSRIRAYIPDFMLAGVTFQAIVATVVPAQPLVYLITTSQGSLALVVPPKVKTLDSEHAVWLDNFRGDDLSELLVQRDASGKVVGGYLVGQLEGKMPLLQTAIDQTLPILRDRLIGPLATSLVDMGFRKATLIPGGRLSLLPLHAASEPITISYAPSARALQAAKTKAERLTGRSPVLLGIGNPLPHPAPITFARTEVESIAPLFAPKARRMLYESQATKAEMQKRLSGVTHLHFACHGIFDVKDPLDSALFLSGEDKLTLRDLLDGNLDLSKSRLAVLSACQTGMTDFTKVPDEAIGLPAGLLQAGVPGVVSTLWPVADISTALLLAQFYRYHLQDGLDAAMALHSAQAWLRDATAADLNLVRCHEHLYRDSGCRDAGALECVRYYRVNPGVKPFSHPYYWAGFIFSGA